MVVEIRVGDGRTASGKILDRHTTYYLYNPGKRIDERKHAVEEARKTGKQIWVSINGRKYRRSSIVEILTLETLWNGKASEN